MNRELKNQYMPDYAVPPGEILNETLETIGMTQAELAERTGRPKKTINEIIKGKAAITPETAIQLERVLGIPASFWNNLERNYQEALARIKEHKELSKNIDKLNKFPVKELIKLGWIKSCNDKVEQLKELLIFFGVATFEQWEKIWLSNEISYRKSKAFETNPYSTSAWIRKGELLAQEKKCNIFNENKFKDVLFEIRKLTNLPLGQIFHKVEELCKEAGVAVVVVPELKGVRVHGATWWANPNKAVIQLSFRYKTEDHFWFSFFHEAGHILLHGKKEKFIEDDCDTSKELEANKFANDFLIPTKKYLKFCEKKEFNKDSIIKLAQEINIAPGIIVGRLQHEGLIPYSKFNELKQKIALNK